MSFKIQTGRLSQRKPTGIEIKTPKGKTLHRNFKDADDASEPSTATKIDPERNQRFEERILQMQLDEIQSIFAKEALTATRTKDDSDDSDNDDHFSYQEEQDEVIEPQDFRGTLNEEQFIQVFKKLMGNAMTEEQLHTLFMRIDANANGCVDWTEFSSFIVLGSEGARKMRNEYESKEYVTYRNQLRHPPHAFHKDVITRIIPNGMHTRYFTASRDGSVKTWDAKTLAWERTIHTSNVWVTDLAYLPSTSELVVAGVDRVISIYDAESGDLRRTYKGKKTGSDEQREIMFKKIPTAPTVAQSVTMREKATLDPNKSAAIRERQNTHRVIEKMKQDRGSGEKIDTARKIEMVTMEDLVGAPMCIAIANIDSRKELLLLGLDEGYVQVYDVSAASYSRRLCRISHSGRMHPHKDWVTKIKPASELDSIITSSLDKTIQIVNLERQTGVRTLLGHNKSIFSIDYSNDLKLIASCGLERNVLIWNPFVSRHLEELREHKAPLVDVCFNSPDYQLISLSTDKTIKVWDVRMFKCMQTMRCDAFAKETANYSAHFNNYSLSSLFVDEKNSCIISGANAIGQWTMKRNLSEFRKQYRGHQKPLVCALYNEKFKQVVSADSHHVCVWDVDDGSLVFRFYVEQVIVAISFDGTGRRLIASTADGPLLVYNYINGQLLKKLENPLKRDIVALKYIEKELQGIRAVIGGGWGRRLYIWYEDDSPFSSPEVICPDLENDIQVIEFCPPTTIVVGSSGARLYIIDLLSRAIRFIVDHPTDATQEPISNETPVGGVPSTPVLLPQRSTRSILSGRTHISVMTLKGRIGSQVQLKASPTSQKQQSQPQTQRSLDQEESLRSQYEDSDPRKAKHEQSSSRLVPRLQLKNIRSGMDISSGSSSLSSSQSSLTSPKTTTSQSQRLHAAVVETTRRFKHSDRRNVVQRMKLEKVGASDTDFIEAIVQLVKKVTVLVTCNSTGLLTFWDTNECKPLYTMRAAAESVTSLCTTQANDLLFTGDSEGFISVMDISRIAVRPTKIVAEQIRLQNRFRGHKKQITSITYLKQYSMILTASDDCTVAIWGTSGHKIGFFGQDQRWQLNNPLTYGLRGLSQLKLVGDDSDASTDDSGDELSPKRSPRPLGSKSLQRSIAQTSMSKYRSGYNPAAEENGQPITGSSTDRSFRRYNTNAANSNTGDNFPQPSPPKSART